MKNVNESLIIDVDEIKNDDVNLNEIRKQFDKEIKQMPDGMREIMINQKNMYLKIRKMEDEKIRFIAEIERLKEEFEKERYLVDKYTRQLTDEYKNTEYQCKEKERLNNIINELEKFIDSYELGKYNYKIPVFDLKEKIHELKGDGSNDSKRNV